MNNEPLPTMSPVTPTAGSVLLKRGYDSGTSGSIYLQAMKTCSYEVYPPTDIMWRPELHTQSQTVNQTVKRIIEELAAMPENWDGYGALRISAETRRNALKALDALLDVPTPGITPNANGTLSFEWESPRGVAHLEIGRTRFSFYIKPLVGNPILDDERVEQLGHRQIRLVAQHLFPGQGYASTTPVALFERKPDASQVSFTINPALLAKAS
jgi:hypothetical protein